MVCRGSGIQESYLRKDRTQDIEDQRNCLGRQAVEGESPVLKGFNIVCILCPKYYGAREIP